ncbi:MAG TPA: site-2 protease family protein, partial [Abditibacteriaceae bacterium]|nr:site-2 protease family protein [Abditibacteriaceae bacterium]
MNLLLSLPAFVIAFTIHEFAHAWAADRLGDDTPRRMGRLTLDPIAHLDPFGSIMFVLTALVGFGLGWAKPVPFSPRNLGHPRRDVMLIAVAGPVSNLLQVPIWVALLFGFRLLAQQMGWYNGVGANGELAPAILLTTMLQLGIIVNIVLAAFNMLPFPPLDGHYVLEGLGPPFIAELFETIRPYSFMLLMAMSY